MLDTTILQMTDLVSFLEEYGYDSYEIEDIMSSQQCDIMSDGFDMQDEYFWLSPVNGYLYSGNEDDVRALIADSNDNNNNNDKNNINDDTNNDMIYRYTVSVDGKELGFIRAADECELSDKEIYRIDSLLSLMEVPPLRAVQGKSCWFTSKGKQKYNRIIEEISKIFQAHNYIVEEHTTTLNNKEYEQFDEYQVMI